MTNINWLKFQFPSNVEGVLRGNSTSEYGRHVSLEIHVSIPFKREGVLRVKREPPKPPDLTTSRKRKRVSIPFKREGVLQVEFARTFVRRSLSKKNCFNSLQTGRCVASAS